MPANYYVYIYDQLTYSFCILNEVRWIDSLIYKLLKQVKKNIFLKASKVCSQRLIQGSALKDWRWGETFIAPRKSEVLKQQLLKIIRYK